MKNESQHPRKRGRPPAVAEQDGKALIVGAALDLFATQGYSGTSLKMIGDRIGFKPNALYAHFESKDDLKKYILEKYGLPAIHLEVNKSEVVALLFRPEKSLKSLFDRLVSQWLLPNELKVFKFLLRESLGDNLDPSLQISEMIKTIRERLLLLIKILVKSRRLKSLDPEWLCTQFLSPIVTIRMEMAFSPTPPQFEQVQQKIHRHIGLFFEVFKK